MGEDENYFTTPDSFMKDTPYQGLLAIDGLGIGLAKDLCILSPFTSIRTLPICCRGGPDCVDILVWMAFQSKLENRLILCAGRLLGP